MAVQPYVTGANFVLIETQSTSPLFDFGGKALTQTQIQTANAGVFPEGLNPAGATSSSKYAYLGTASHCPKPTLTRAWRPVGSSYRGLAQGSERAYMGEQADIFMVLSRWDENVYRFCASFVGASSRGSFLGGSIGCLLNAQKLGIILHILFPYQKFPKYSGQPKGYRFVNSILVDDILLEEGGTEGRMLGLHWQGHAMYNDDQDLWNLYDLFVGPVPAPQ